MRFLQKNILNPILARGGGGLGPPWRFLEITRKVLVSTGCSNFLNFLTNTLAQSGAFIPTARVLRHILPECLILQFFPTKSIFRPSSGHWILTFYSSSESFKQKEADCTIFAKKFYLVFIAQMHLNRICTFSVFLEWKFSFRKP